MIDNFIAIAQSLGKFQLIESALKVFLVNYQIGQDKLNGNLKESYSVSEIVDIPYGLLLKRYKKICIDQSLCDRLLIIKDYRNYLAHQAFVASLNMSTDMKRFIGVNPIVIDYVELNKELDECVVLMIQEFNLFLRNN